MAESPGPWLPGDPRPWLPGCPLIGLGPEPAIPRMLERHEPPGARALQSVYTEGLPNNIVNSLFSCVDGENKRVAIRDEYYENNPPPAEEPP